MANYVTNSSDKSRGVAMLLCLFLGWAGIHYFYVGRIGKGLLYLFTGGFFFIGWFIDCFKILLGSYRDNVGAPLRQWSTS